MAASTTTPTPEETSPVGITWSSPATTPHLSEEEINDLRQTLRLLHELLSNNIHNEAEGLLPTANATFQTGPTERKRQKAMRFFKANGPRIVGAATAMGLGILNIVTSVGC